MTSFFTQISHMAKSSTWSTSSHLRWVFLVPDLAMWLIWLKYQRAVSKSWNSVFPKQGVQWTVAIKSSTSRMRTAIPPLSQVLVRAHLINPPSIGSPVSPIWILGTPAEATNTGRKHKTSERHQDLTSPERRWHWGEITASPYAREEGGFLALEQEQCGKRRTKHHGLNQKSRNNENKNPWNDH